MSYIKNISKGKWVVSSKVATMVELDDANRSLASTGGFQDGTEEAENAAAANAMLIAEAGNVANETGLTPRQLLDQRNKLMEAIASICVLDRLENLVKNIINE